MISVHIFDSDYQLTETNLRDALLEKTGLYGKSSQALTFPWKKICFVFKLITYHYYTLSLSLSHPFVKQVIFGMPKWFWGGKNDFKQGGSDMWSILTHK